MNKNIIIVLGVIVVILLAAIFFLPSRTREAAPPPPPPSAGAGTSSSEETAIEISAQGFSPSNITIPAGTAVRFTNKDAKLHWPASGIHPTHQVCPGFDSLKPLQPGESYSFTFTEAKTCPMHDHLNPQVRGSIVVQ